MGNEYHELSSRSESAGLSRLCGSALCSSAGSFQGSEHTVPVQKKAVAADAAGLLRQLQHILQLLALPIRAQVHLVEDDCTRTRQLTRAFRATYLRVHTEQAVSLAADQIRALDRLDIHLEQLSQDYALTLCSELAMRESHAWRRTRLMAREALIGFGWDLALPSQGISLRETKVMTPGAS